MTDNSYVDPNDHAIIAPEKLFLQQLIKERIHRGMSQTALAERTGLSQPAIARVEAGKVSPTLATLVKIADALGTQLTVLPKD